MGKKSQINRRNFLGLSLLALGGGSVKMNTSILGAPAGFFPFMELSDEKGWVETIRNRIPATKESIYFQTAGIAPATTGAIDEIKRRLDYQNRGPADPRFNQVMAKIEPELRGNLAAVFGTDPEEVALTHSTTEGINIAIWSINWKENDEVIISNQEHPANIIPWYNLRDRFGIKIREINLDTGTHLLSEIKNKLSPGTRMVSISHVTRNNGRRLRDEESAELADLLRKKQIRYHLDGAQGPGNVPVDFHHLGCDYYSICGHKWLLGPKGTGACFIRKGILEGTKLTWIGSHSHVKMSYDGDYSWKPDASRFEFGTRALAEFAGFNYAVQLMDKIGFEKVFKRIRELVQYAIELTKASKKFKVISPENEAEQSGILVIRLPEGNSGRSIYDKLWQKEHILTSPVRVENHLRIAIHFFNNKAEIKETFDILNKYCNSF